MHITKANTEDLLVARKKLGPGMGTETSRYEFVYCKQNAGQNHSLYTDKAGPSGRAI